MQQPPPAPESLAAPQQSGQEVAPIKHLEEEQKAPAIDGAGLPPSDGKCSNEFYCVHNENSHANLSHMFYYYCHDCLYL